MITKKQILNQRYRILGKLGQGGSGITYKAEDIETGQKVALKALSLRKSGNWKPIELFEREAEVLGKLNHPAIPQYLDYLTTETDTDVKFHIVEELAPGKSLAKWGQKGRRLKEKEVKDIAQQVLKILIYLHSITPPVIHRDIKPGNLIRTEEGKIFLVDFGAVQHTYYTTLMRGSTAVGTIGYAAPEQWTSKAIPASDLYSLGATVLFLLTHRNPAELSEDDLRIEVRDHVNISEGFANWLEKMLEPIPEERFPTARDSLTALRRSPFVVPLPQGEWIGWLQGGMSLLGVGVAGFLVVYGLNAYKWALLSRAGFYPEKLCENEEVTISFFKKGGKLAASKECLFWAINNNHTEIVELLIANGANINVRDNDGYTPLYSAVSWGNKEVVKLLIANGADVNGKIKDGWTPLHRAAYQGEKEAVKLLIANGADVNAKNNNGSTPLYSAASGGRKEVAELFIAKRADVNAKNNNGNTPLHKAASKGKKEVAELLIAKGADVNAKSKSGSTPLHRSAHRGEKEVAKLLIAKGADVNAKDYKYGRTPLHWAIYEGEKEVAELLIAKGADVNEKGYNDRTSLHEALYGNGNKEVFKLLIANGADVNAKDNDGDTPLLVAVSKRRAEIVELLITEGAKE